MAERHVEVIGAGSEERSRRAGRGTGMARTYHVLTLAPTVAS
jgi:hypothetical protein